MRYPWGVRTTWTRSLDRWQQRSALAGFATAVGKKFHEDGASRLAGLLAFYSFVSLFPLLLVFVTVLSFVLPGHQVLQHQVLHSALGDFPVIGDQLRLHGLHGQWWTLPVSLAFTLWGARGVATATQDALNTVWNVPISERPGLAAGLARALGLLGTLALGVTLTGILAGVGGWGSSTALRIAAIAVSTLISIGAFTLGFRLAIARYVPTQEIVRGAIASALVWQLLLLVGGLLVTRLVNHTQSIYGVFGLVLGLLTWLHVQASLTLLAAESDVVRARRLWPRAVSPPPLTGADRQALTDYAITQRRLPGDEQSVEVSFADDTQTLQTLERVEPSEARAVEHTGGHTFPEGG